MEEEGKFYTCAHTGGTVLVALEYECPHCRHDVESTVISSLDTEKHELTFKPVRKRRAV